MSDFVSLRRTLEPMKHLPVFVEVVIGKADLLDIKSEREVDCSRIAIKKCGKRTGHDPRGLVCLYPDHEFEKVDDLHHEDCFRAGSTIYTSSKEPG